MKDKSIQVRLSKSEIEKLMKEAIIREIEKVIRKANIDEEIKMAVTEAAIDVDLPAVKIKIAELEERLGRVENARKNH